MKFSSLSALDRRIVITGGLAAIAAVISFVDPSGDWGSILAFALVGALGAVFVAVQPQLAPSAQLPVPKGLAILVLGAVTTGGFAIGMLNYIGYISRNLLDPYVIIMIVGLIASIVLLWTGWQAYKAERPASSASSGASSSAAPAAAAAGSSSTPPPPPPATDS